MSDEHSSPQLSGSSKPNTTLASSWSRGLKRWLSTAPETRDELVKILQDSRQLLEPDTVDMLEGVLDLPAIKIHEIMTPISQAVTFHDEQSLSDIMSVYMECIHSRYPVFSANDSDNAIGILLAKDLIPMLVKKARGETLPEFDVKQVIRQPIFISETARADSLLRLLQKNQMHMAIVMDEFGNTAGIVTMEDLLEEIVGDIVDEHDDIEVDSGVNHIVPVSHRPDTWIVQAVTPISDCNDQLGTTFDHSEVDSMGGLVMQELGQVNSLLGQVVYINDCKLTVLSVDDRLIQEIELVTGYAPEHLSS